MRASPSNRKWRRGSCRWNWTDSASASCWMASSEDQSAIFDGWCGFLNYFDSALPFQLSFINHRSRGGSRYKVNIPMAHDDFDSIRGEYVDMLKRQIARSNNGIVRSKYITFGVPADGLETARPRLERVSSDIMGNFKKLGAHSRVLNGRERLEMLHGQMHPGGREPFRFSWPDIVKTGMGTKDFIAPDSFDFTAARTFRLGQSWGAASYLQIMASELSDSFCYIFPSFYCAAYFGNVCHFIPSYHSFQLRRISH